MQPGKPALLESNSSSWTIEQNFSTNTSSYICLDSVELCATSHSLAEQQINVIRRQGSAPGNHAALREQHQVSPKHRVIPPSLPQHSQDGDSEGRGQALQPKTQQNAEPWATGAGGAAHPHQASLALPHWGTRSDLPPFSGGRSSSQHAVTPSFLYISFISVPQLPPHTSFPHRSRAEGDASALRGRAAARRAAPAPSSPPPRLPAAFPGPGPPPSSSVHRRRRGRSRGGFTERRWFFFGGERGATAS